MLREFPFGRKDSSWVLQPNCSIKNYCLKKNTICVERNVFFCYKDNNSDSRGRALRNNQAINYTRVGIEPSKLILMCTQKYAKGYASWCICISNQLPQWIAPWLVVVVEYMAKYWEENLILTPMPHLKYTGLNKVLLLWLHMVMIHWFTLHWVNLK